MTEDTRTDSSKTGGKHKIDENIVSEKKIKLIKPSLLKSGSWADKYQALNTLSSGNENRGPIYFVKVRDIKGFSVDCFYRGIIKEFKILRKDILSCYGLAEIYILQKLDHPNIIKIREIYIENETLAILLDCYQYTAFNLCCKLSESDLRKFCYELLSAVAYCHSEGVIHRDIKPQNIYFPSKNIYQPANMVLADFDHSRELLPEPISRDITTLPVRPIEFFVYKEDFVRYDYSLDIWSLGMTILTMLKGSEVLSCSTSFDMVTRICSLLGTPTEDTMPLLRQHKFEFDLPSYKESIFDPKSTYIANAVLKDLLSRMLVYDPAKRITASEALKHPYFNCYDNKPILGIPNTPRPNFTQQLSIQAEIYNQIDPIGDWIDKLDQDALDEYPDYHINEGKQVDNYIKRVLSKVNCSGSENECSGSGMSSLDSEDFAEVCFICYMIDNVLFSNYQIYDFETPLPFGRRSWKDLRLIKMVYRALEMQF